MIHASILWLMLEGLGPVQLVTPIERGKDSAIVVLNTELAELDSRCPRRMGQFEVGSRAHPDWLRRNQAGWDPGSIRKVVQEAVSRSAREIAGPTPVVCVSIAGRGAERLLERMRGIGGLARAPNTIALFVAPAISPAWLESLPFTISHEYHHLAAPIVAVSGLDVLVREGKAHHFAWSLYAHLLHPSAVAIRDNQIREAISTIGEHLADTPARFTREFMFGGEYFGGKVPTWAGYTVGYILVRDYAQERPGLSLADLSRVDAARIWVDRAEPRR